MRSAFGEGKRYLGMMGCWEKGLRRSKHIYFDALEITCGYLPLTCVYQCQ